MILQVNNLSHRFNKRAVLKNINLQISEPGLYVFTGANGSGKSTLFNCITGMLQPQKGKLTTPSQLSGIVYEPVSTEPNLTVEQVIEIAKSIRKATQQEVNDQLKYWDLDQHRHKTFNALSLGMRKRLMIACALIGNSKVHIWDEPLNGLDPLGMNKLRIAIQELINKRKTVLLSTHILGELDDIATEIYVLKDGEIAFSFQPDEKDKTIKQQILEVL